MFVSLCVCVQRQRQVTCNAGSGGLPEAMIPVVKAQLLAFLIYTTPPMLQQQLQAVGQGSGQPEEASEEEQKEPDLAHMLPGPCPVLRRLVAFDPGQPMPILPCQSSRLRLLSCANQMPHFTAAIKHALHSLRGPAFARRASKLFLPAPQLHTTSTLSNEICVSMTGP